MQDGSPTGFKDGCSNLAKFSRRRNKNFPKIFLRGTQDGWSK